MLINAPYLGEILESPPPYGQLQTTPQPKKTNMQVQTVSSQQG